MALSKLSKSASVTVVAVAAMANACALPRVKPRMAKDFQSGEVKVRKVAILPVDLGVQIKGKNGRLFGDPRLGDKVMDRINRGLAASLGKRGYDVRAIVHPDGTALDPDPKSMSTGVNVKRLVIHPTDLSALRVEIHEATSFHGPGPGLIAVKVSSDLTRQLGKTTGTDASLYARGWVYVDPTSESSGATAAKVIGITLLAVFIVGVIIMLAASKGKGGGGFLKGAGKALAVTGRAVAKTAAVMGEIAIRTLPYVLEIAARAHATRHVHVHCHRCVEPPPPPPPPPSMPPQHGTQTFVPEDQPPIAIPAPPAAASRQSAPAQPQQAPPTLVMHTGSRPPSRSTVGIAMTLVHNDSGRVLWHAGQKFEVEAKGNGDVERLIEHFLKELPVAAR